METPTPNDFDWVTARSQCTITSVFERLYLRAKRNVDTRNALGTIAGGGPFACESNGKTFSVSRSHSHGDVVRVLFRWDGPHIYASGAGVDLTATLTLNDAGRCLLKINGQELEDWQVLRRALEGLFF